ncbi:RDD family protein [Paenisporosarcina sp. OV554]|uniref:RDD family protein n=1 Tax=Paenisporosarcina sp. OV554 TaxID=2135694 RepID=UPI000D370E41|nr:RDD family protein [Paenisporosarcina sp. OV554]PUB13385.1 putative RDD family membrane protein YckC [Paenisporosarcina sp. OV554]
MTNPAGFWVRLLANIIDSLVIGIPVGTIAYIATGNWENEDFSTPLSILYSILIPILWYGYTVGKRIMNVRIVKVDGSKLGIGAMLMRVIVAGLIYVVTLGIAAIVSAFMVGIREDKRSLHDLIAGTYVTYNAPGDENDVLVNE